MKTIWYNHLTDEAEILDFKKRVLSAIDVLRRLHTMSTDKVSAISTTRINSRTYDNASWPYLHAHLNGKEEAYSEILSILNLNITED